MSDLTGQFLHEIYELKAEISSLQSRNDSLQALADEVDLAFMPVGDVRCGEWLDDIKMPDGSRRMPNQNGLRGACIEIEKLRASGWKSSYAKPQEELNKK